MKQRGEKRRELTGGTEERPAIDETGRAVQLGRGIEPVDEQIGHSRLLRRFHFEMKGEGHVHRDGTEIQLMQVELGIDSAGAVRREGGRRDVLQDQRRRGQVGIAGDQQLDGRVVHFDRLVVGEEGEGERTGEVRHPSAPIVGRGQGKDEGVVGQARLLTHR